MSDTGAIPPAARGFESIKRTWDPVLRMPCARVLPGEYYVTPHDEALLTVLGSCVSACIRVPRLRLGGINHFMLAAEGEAGDGRRAGADTMYGTFAMERLVNELVKRGGQRSEMEVKVAGGGQMYLARCDVGRTNLAFVFQYLEAEALTVVAKDVGGPWPRKIQYYPRSGRLRIRKLPAVEMEAVGRDEQAHRSAMAARHNAGSVELF